MRSMSLKTLGKICDSNVSKLRQEYDKNLNKYKSQSDFLQNSNEEKFDQQGKELTELKQQIISLQHKYDQL